MDHSPTCKNAKCPGCGTYLQELEAKNKYLCNLLRRCAVYRNGSGEYCDICYEESAAHCSCCGACLGVGYDNVCDSPSCELAKEIK